MGISRLNSQAQSIMALNSIVSNEESFRSLFTITGTPDNSDYVDIITLQRRLATLSTTHDYIMDMYILFPNNPIYISDAICSDDYRKVFPTFLNDQSSNADAWYQFHFADPTSYRMNFFTGPVYSYYSQPQSYSALTFVTQLSPYTNMRKDCVMVCNLNFDEVVKNMVLPDILDDCFLYITDSHDSIIGQYHYFLDTPIEGDTYEIDSTRYTIVRTQQTDYGFSATLGIPDYYFSHMVRSSFFIIELFFLIAIICLLLFYLFISVRESIAMRKIVRTSSSLFSVPEEAGEKHNEYTYINHVLKHNAETLDSLNHQLKTFTLINLLLNNIQHDESYIKKLFGLSFDAYCVVVIRLGKHDTEEIDPHYLFHVEELSTSFLKIPFLSAHTNANELSLLLALSDVHIQDTSRIFTELQKLLNLIQQTEGNTISVHMGLSSISSGIKHIHEAYQQAKDIINISANPETSDIFIYNRPRQLIHHKAIDISLLLKCYDGILCGDTKVVDEFFQEVDKIIAKHYYDLQEPFQLLFSVRHPIYNAYMEIISANEINNTPFDLKPPIMDQHLPLQQNIAVLLNFSYQLCEQVQIQRQSRQIRFKENILNYIRTECFDVNFSAYSVMNQFQVSENYVLQLVKEATGKSFKNFVESLRIDKAEDMLTNTNETNISIATACGFGSETTFYRAFARRHGVTPSKWADKS